MNIVVRKTMDISTSVPFSFILTFLTSSQVLRLTLGDSQRLESLQIFIVLNHFRWFYTIPFGFLFMHLFILASSSILYYTLFGFLSLMRV